MKKIFKSLLVVLIFISFCYVKAETKTYEQDGFTITIKDGVMTFNGTGDMPKFEIYNAPWQNEKDNVKKIIIGEGITSTSNYALYQFSNVEEVVLPSTLITMPEGTAAGFYTDGNLKKIVVAKENPAYVVVDNVLYNKDMKKLVLYPRGKNNEIYKIPEGITTIGSHGIVSNKNLKKIVFPSSVTDISSRGIQSNPNLVEFVVDNNNPVYSSKDGILFNKDKTKLVSFPPSREGNYKLPDSVTSLEEYSFYHCKLTNVDLNNLEGEIPYFSFGYCGNMTSFIIPEKVTSIGMYAISETGIKDITIPASVTSINGGALRSNNSLETITILGVDTVIKDTQSLNAFYNDYDASNGEIKKLDTVIRGFEGSTAQSFAEANNRVFVVLDDMTYMYTSYNKKQVYTGKELTPEVIVKDGNKVLEKDKDYTVTYTNNIKIGTGKITISAKEGSGYKGSKELAFSIKKKNTIKVKTKKATVNYKKLKKKNQKVSVKKLFKVTKAKGKVTYEKVSGNSKITISSSGKVTIKKKLKKGTYKVKVKVTAKGNGTYYSKSKEVTIKIKVK